MLSTGQYPTKASHHGRIQKAKYMHARDKYIASGTFSSSQIKSLYDVTASCSIAITHTALVFSRS